MYVVSSQYALIYLGHIVMRTCKAAGLGAMRPGHETEVIGIKYMINHNIRYTTSMTLELVRLESGTGTKVININSEHMRG